MKTAISIPDELCDQVQTIAGRMGIPRSQLSDATGFETRKGLGDQRVANHHAKSKFPVLLRWLGPTDRNCPRGFRSPVRIESAGTGLNKSGADCDAGRGSPDGPAPVAEMKKKGCLISDETAVLFSF